MDINELIVSGVKDDVLRLSNKSKSKEFVKEYFAPVPILGVTALSS